MFLRQLFLSCLFFFLSCNATLNVAYLLPGSVNDNGWNEQIFDSTIIVQDYFGVIVNVQVSTNVGFTLSACYNKAVEYILNGTFVFILPTGAYQSCAEQLSLNYSNIFVFVQLALPSTFSRVSSDIFIPGLRDARYVNGVLLGKQHNLPVVCFVENGVEAVNKAILWMNMLYLGLVSENLNVQYHVATTTSFDSEIQEIRVFNYFSTVKNCNVIVSQQNSNRIPLLASSANIPSVGWGHNMIESVGEQVLQSIIKNWDIPIIKFINSILYNSTFTSDVYYDTLENNGVELSQVSALVDNAAFVHARNAERKIISEKLNPLCGEPVLQQYGTECTNEENLSLNYLPGYTVINWDMI